MAILTLKQPEAIAQVNTVGLACYSVQTYLWTIAQVYCSSSGKPHSDGPVFHIPLPFQIYAPEVKKKIGPLFQTHNRHDLKNKLVDRGIGKNSSP